LPEGILEIHGNFLGFWTILTVGEMSESDPRRSDRSKVVAQHLMGSDEQLMLEFQQGSAEAFTELFESYREPIYGFFRRRMQDAARARSRALQAMEHLESFQST
jgi:hypothetical protein